MRIAVLLDRARLFRWHLALIDALSAAGHVVVVRYRETSDALPTSLTAILDFDRARGHTSSDRFSTHLKASALAPSSDVSGPPSEITLDLSSASMIQRIAGPVVRPAYDGSPKDYALFHALLDRRAPHLTIWHSEYPAAFEIGTPALETPSRLATSLDQTTSRLVEGLVRFFNARPEHFPVATGAIIAPSANASEASILASAGSFLTARTLRKVRRLRDTFSGNAPRWHVAWRPLPVSQPITPASLYLTDYQVLADDSERAYSDPFVVERDGVAHVFVSELPEATGIGVISHVVLGPYHKSETPRMVLQAELHLSNPYVFERDGSVWMMPEQSAAGGLDLYRCTRFPDSWVRECRLVDGRLHDATLFEYDGLLWIAAGCEAFQSSTWDGLALYWSQSLTGPWHPHALNPVIVDAQAARPAGPAWHDDGKLYRPAQDCSGGFGSAVTLKRVTTLTRDTFAEETAGSVAFARHQKLLGPHTISRGGGIEVIDLYARPGAIRSAYRAGYRSPIGL